MTRAVVVFGASGGLGRDLLRGLAAAGYEVHGTAHRTRVALDEVLRELELDPARHAFTVDATDYAQVRACIDELAGRTNLWAAINLVGVPTARRLTSAPPDEVVAAIHANLLPAMWITKALLESRKERGERGGRLVHPSSVVLRRPLPGTIPYAAAKGAVEGMVRAAAEEAARYDMTVNALRLGYFETGMGASVPEEILAGVRAATAHGRLGTADDLTAVTTFLLRDESEFLTGATVDVDGGLI